MYVYLLELTMSLITTLSVKEEHKTQYYSMRNWLKQKNISMGDYIIGKFNDEFADKQNAVLTN